MPPKIVDETAATHPAVSVPLTGLVTHPANPRHGDIGAIVESLKAHEQYRPIVVKRDGMQVLAGNHTMLAARALGWERIDAVILDVDDEEGVRIMLADNRTAELATYDDRALTDLLMDLQQQTPAGLAGTGFDGDALDRLLRDLSHGPPPVAEGVDETDRLVASWAVVVQCTSEHEQLTILERLAGEGLDVKALTG